MSASVSSIQGNSASVNALTPKDGPINLYKYRWLFIGISLLFLIPGIYFIVLNCLDSSIQAPVRLGIDFKGGTLLEYGFSKPMTQVDIPQIRAAFDQRGYTGSVIQIQGNAAKAMKAQQVSTSSGDASRALNAQVQSVISIRSKQIHGQDDLSIRQALESRYGHITVLQKNSMGPALAQELLTNGILALLMAYILIVGYLTVRFQFDFAVCAMVALVHDTVFLLGMFAILGRLFHTEVDSLFITAVLTVVGFSVHDTIVVFDRIRENNRLYFTKKVPFISIANMSINQTMARSINTSLTALLSMLALYFFGGDTTKDFVLAIILGIAAGTYSSVFNASVLLAMWRQRTTAS